MLVLIDESGCSGFKLNKGSSPYFTLAMVIFHDPLEAEKVSDKISKLRTELRIKNEFKFSKAHPNVRDKFFSVVSEHNFIIRALVVNKNNITSTTLKKHHGNFYNYFLKMLLEYDAGILHNATIKIDGRGDKNFKKSLTTYLRNQLGEDKFNNIKFRNSANDNLIQLADMVVGAIARSSNETAKNNQRWIEILQRKGRIDNIWNFK